MQNILFILRNNLQLFLTYCVISQDYSIFTQSKTEDSINIMCEPTITERISLGCKRDHMNPPSGSWQLLPGSHGSAPAPKWASAKGKHQE